MTYGPYITRIEANDINFTAATSNPAVLKVRINRHNTMILISTAPVEIGAGNDVVFRTMLAAFREQSTEKTAYGTFPVTHVGYYELVQFNIKGKVQNRLNTRFTRNGIIVGGGSWGGKDVDRIIEEIGYSAAKEAA